LRSPNRAGKSRPGDIWIVLIAMALYVVVVGSLSVRRFDSYDADMFDLGIMEQTIWNTSHGRILNESVNLGFPRSRIWSGRWELIYLPIAVLYRLLPHPFTGLLFQTLLLAMGAIPVYLLARDRLGGGLVSIAMPIAYLLYPALHNANLFDLHGIAMSTTMVLFAFYFLTRGARWPFYLFILLLLSCREDASFIAFMLGLYAMVVERHRRAGCVVMALSVGWFFFAQNFSSLRPIMGLPPLASPDVFAGRWEGVGGTSPISFIAWMAGHPLNFLSLLWRSENLELLIKLFSPVGFLSFLSPSSLALLLPNLGVNMISGSSLTNDIYHHYTATLTPVVFISAVFGLGNLIDKHRDAEVSNSSFLPSWLFRPTTISAALLISSAIATTLWSRTIPTASLEVTPHDRSIDKFVERIPTDASVSAHSLIGPHVAHRENLYLFPDGVGNAEFIIYDLTLPFSRMMSHESWGNPIVIPLNDPFLKLLDDDRYGVVAFQDGTILFRKGADHAKGMHHFKVDTLPSDRTLSSSIDLGPIALVGAGTEGFSGSSDKYLHLSIYWRRKAGQLAEGYTVTLAVETEDSEIVYEHRPLYGLMGKYDWKTGSIIRDDAFIPLGGIGPGSHEILIEGGSLSDLTHLIDVDIEERDLAVQ